MQNGGAVFVQRSGAPNGAVSRVAGRHEYGVPVSSSGSRGPRVQGMKARAKGVTKLDGTTEGAAPAAGCDGGRPLGDGIERVCIWGWACGARPSWLARGPRSSRPPGLIGLTGARGETGPQGARGPMGPMGARGPQGLMGLRGPAGPQGATGPQDPTGGSGTNGTPSRSGMASMLVIPAQS